MPLIEPPHPSRSRAIAIWVVLGVGVLVIGICAAIALSRHRQSGTTEEGSGPKLTPEQQARLEAPLAELDKLDDMVKKYRESRVEERHLRARDVLMKINSYEPVTGFEYELRGQVLEEEKEATQSAGGTAEESDPWKLNQPLGPSEKEKLGQLSDDLQSQSTRLETELGTIGISLAPVKDSLGRALLDGAEVSARLAARRENIMKEAAGGAP